MKKVKRSWDLLSDEQRESAVERITCFFDKERNESIGIIAAESLLDLFLQSVGTALYNKGIENAAAFLKDRMEEIELDMSSLLKN